MVELSSIPKTEIIGFKNQRALHVWLSKNHARSQGIWIHFYNKHSGVSSVTYQEALEEALCVGWIDSLVKKYDAQSRIQRFGPRKPKSVWSVVNKKKVAALVKAGKMQPAGIAAVNAAKKDGRWKAAYRSPSKVSFPEEVLQGLDAATREYALSLNRANVYFMYFQLHTAKKPETKARRLERIHAHLRARKKWH